MTERTAARQAPLAHAAFAIGIIWALLAAAPCAAATYAIDKRHTEVRFAYSVGFSNQRGRFTSVDGKVDYEAAAPEKTTVTAVIATASLTTGEPLMDQTLKGSDFFNVEEQPQMTFTSRAVRSTGPGTAEMTGDITVNGITRPVQFAVSIAAHDEPELKYSKGRLEFLARGRIKRSAFNMTAFADMAGDDIDIEIDAVLRAAE